MTVNASRVASVAPGLALVEHSDGIKYAVVNDAAKTLTLPASSGGTQITAIYLLLDTTAVQASIGRETAAAGAGNPALPANALLLAYVSVPLSGDPTVSLPATRFAAPKSTAAAAAAEGGGGPSGRTIQRPGSANVAVMLNDRLFTRNADRLWALQADDSLVEYELGCTALCAAPPPRVPSAARATASPCCPTGTPSTATCGQSRGTAGTSSRARPPAASRRAATASRWSISRPARPLTFAAFGDGGAIGVQSGGNYYIVGNSGAGNAVMVAEVSIALTVSGGVVQLTAGANGILQHSANIATPITFAAPGDAAAYLRGLLPPPTWAASIRRRRTGGWSSGARRARRARPTRRSRVV